MIQQTIQEVKFEDIILAKKQRQARKTNKIRHFLQYLHMLDENRAFHKKNQSIKEHHRKFVFREDFWLAEVKRVLADVNQITPEAFDWAFMAVEDGFYINVAQFIAQKLFEAHNAQKLRLNFVVAKLEILIAQFDHCTKDCIAFFEALLGVYVKTNNTKKIRETYKRWISMGFDNYDVVYAKYLQWQEAQGNTESKQQKELLQKARECWEQVQIFNQEQLSVLENSNEFVPTQRIKADKRNIKRCLVHLQNVNSARVDEKKYLTLLNLFESNAQKLWYLRRMALNQTHEMVQKYFKLLQLSGAEDDHAIEAFKNSFGWSFNESNLQLYESLYFSYLIRRINKHLSKAQDEDYNNSWGSNVQFFRNEVSELISKQRSNIRRQKELVAKYYKLWIQVETALVKDVATVQQIFDNFLEWGPSQQIYIDYANCMVRLGDISKARWVFSKTCESQNYEGDIVKEYSNFINIYGSSEELIKLEDKLAIKAAQKAEATKVIPIVHSSYQAYERKLNEKQKGQSNQQPILQHSPLQISSSLHLDPQNSEKPLNQQEKPTQPNFKRPLPTQSPQQDQIQNNHAIKKKVHLDSNNTLFSQHVQKNWTEADIMLDIVFKQCVKDIRVINKPKGKFCYIEFDTEESAQKQLKANKSPLNLAFSRPPSKSDDCTLFLCNLPMNVQKNQIKDIMPQGHQENIKDIRIKQKAGKNTAYVEFKDQLSRDDALDKIKAQKIKMGDRAIIALSCESDFRNKDKKYKTVFLKNLSFKCKEKDIQSFFQKQGFSTIAQVFIPKDQKTNRSKGFAYIQFADSQELSKALKLEKGDLHGRQFAITKSDRAINHHHDNNNREQKKAEKEPKTKAQPDNKKSNNFFSNFFS